MPMRQFLASYAFSLSLSKSNQANPDTEKILNELSSLPTANCRLLISGLSRTWFLRLGRHARWMTDFEGCSLSNSLFNMLEE